jgi:energy-coupling factor transporter ATP-binding protein EcfA2
MKLTCRGLRSLTEAEIELGPGLTLVIGANGSGKSSAALAAGALLARDGKLGRTKDDRGRGLVADGARGAVVSLRSEDGHVEISWPEGEVRQKGEAPAASRTAAGLDRPAAVDAKSRAAMLISSLKAEPTKVEWLDACSDCNYQMIDAALAEHAWTLVADQGWDAAVKILANQGRDAKAVWCRITGRSAYQSTGGATWQPDGHETENLAAANVAGQEAIVLAAKIGRDAALTTQAVGAAERDRLAIAANQRQAIDEIEVPQARQAVQEAEDAVGSWEQKLRYVEMCRTLCPCPHCDRPIAIWPPNDPGGPPLRKPANAASVDAKTLAEWRGKQADAKRALEEAQLRQRQALSRQTAAYEADEKLAGLPPLDPLAMEAAELAWTRAKARLAAIEATVDARAVHEQIQALAAAINLAGPSGLRQSKLAQTLDLVNGGLVELCAIAGWPVVLISQELEIGYGGRNWVDLSESERWRVETALAVEIGRRDGSELVVLDRADVLDGRGRNGLLTMAASTGVPILCFMTAPKSQAQAIAATGCAVWLLAAGRCELIRPEPTAAAA